MISAALEALGHEVLLGTQLAGCRPDAQVLELAGEQGAIVLTEDKDFGELVVRERQPHCGVVLVRVIGLDRPSRAVVVCTAITAHEAELPGRLMLITRRSVRLRPPLAKEDGIADT